MPDAIADLPSRCAGPAAEESESGALKSIDDAACPSSLGCAVVLVNKFC